MGLGLELPLPSELTLALALALALTLALTTYSMDDFLVDGEKLGSNEGDRTLVVFRDAGTVVLAAAKNGQTFGPSVLAPKAHVVRDPAPTRT